MLDNTMAQRLIDKAAKYMNYNMNIMDKQGIIIASRDTTRIGTFHEAAFRILGDNKDIEIVDENSNYMGARPGVNLTIKYKDENLGVIGVSGNPDEVLNVAYIVKMSIEAMLEYELYKEEIWQRQNKKDLMLNILLYSYDIDMAEVEAMAKKLEYNTHILRIPIFIKNKKEQDPRHILDILKKNPLHSKQDISTITRDDNIIVFKSLNGDAGKVLKGYKEKVIEYINSFLKVFAGSGEESFLFYVGTIQSSFTNYKESYRHATWLSLIVDEDKKIYFFYEYISEYLRHMITIKTYKDIFNFYEKIVAEDETGKVFIETVEALQTSNYNLVNSAKKLFIHRNTLMFRLNKIKETLNVDPAKNYNDRQFLYHLAYYLKGKNIQ